MNECLLCNADAERGDYCEECRREITDAGWASVEEFEQSHDHGCVCGCEVVEWDDVGGL